MTPRQVVVTVLSAIAGVAVGGWAVLALAAGMRGQSPVGALLSATTIVVLTGLLLLDIVWHVVDHRRRR